MFGYFKVLGRISELETTLTKLWKEMERRDLDWEEMHVRCKRLMTRAERAERTLTVVESNEAPQPPEGTDGQPIHGRLLTARQLQVQQQILRKRAGL